MTHTNSRIASRPIVSMLTVLILLLTAVLAYADQKELDDIRGAIKAKGAKWVADETSISKLSGDERKKHLGEDDTMAKDAEAAQFSELPVASDAIATALSPSLDYQNINGVSYVTPIKNQGSCGSCWAFAVTAALESQVLMDAGLPLDLSEQVLVSCSGAGTCSGGSSASASNYIRDVGLPLESCFGYTAANTSCGLACTNYRTDTYRVIGWHSASNAVDSIKNALYTYGPVVTTFYVYGDFFSYRSGIYSYATGAYQGAHAVLTVGYDDVNQCFIVKNSWGTGWGEAGFFRIAYSEVTGTSRFGYSVLAYDGYPTTTCVQANPTLALSPSSQSMTAGSSAKYTVSVTNNDNSVCANSTFNLSAGVPSGWSASFGSSSLQVSAGGSGSTTITIISPATASGSNSITVTATDSATPAYTASSSANASIQAPVCTRANPKVALSPTVSNWVKKGTAVIYTLSVTNNDSSVCPASSFNLDATVPSNWTGSFGSPALTISPGGSSTTTLSVASPASAPDGSYTITAKGANSTQLTYVGTASAVETLISSLIVWVSTDKLSYRPNQPVSIKATVSAGGSAVPNATVTFTVTNTNGGTIVATKSVTTDTYGNASFTWAQKSKSGSTYSIRADAAFNTITGIGTATFKIQ